MIAPEPYFPLINTLPGEWVHEAACASSMHKDAFHPSYEDGRDPKADGDYAKAVCRSCPVRSACLDWALEMGTGLVQGIAGGLSEDDRRALLRRKRRAAA